MKKLFEFIEHIGRYRVLIQSRDIQNGAIKSSHIVDDAVTTDKIGDKAVTTEKIADRSVTGEKVQDKAITPEQLSDDFNVTERMIADKAVTTDKIGDNAVTENKIDDGAVTTEKIGDNAVTEDKIAPNAVVAGNIAPGAVGRTEIAPEAVTDLNALYTQMRGELEEELDTKTEAQDDKIEALEKQDVVPVDTLPAVSGADPKKIYRLVGSTSYIDYMVNAAGDGWKELATFSFPGIDDVPTAGSDNLVKSGGVQNELALGAVYDVSAKNPTAGPNNDGKFTLEYILDQNNVNTLIPSAVRKGGMSIKFVQSSDNKYVQYRLMSYTFNTTPANWQGVDEEPTINSQNLSNSGGVYNDIFELIGLSDVPDHAGWINSNNKFDLASGTCKLLPVKGGDIVNIIGNGVYFFVLKSYKDGDVDPDFATGYNTRQTAGTGNLTMPSDARVLAISSTYNGNNRMPVSITINGKEVVKPLNSRINIVNCYHLCSSASGENKSINVKGFVHREGYCFVVKFQFANTLNNAKINVNESGNHNLYYRGAVVTAENSWADGDILICYINNNAYHLFNYGVDNITKNQIKALEDDIKALEDDKIETKELSKSDLTKKTPGYFITKDNQDNYTISLSGAWESYLFKIDEDWNTKGTATLYTNTTGAIGVAYLSGETVNVDNIISSDIFLGSATSKDFSISIPTGAKYILFNSRAQTGTCSIGIQLSRQYSFVEIHKDLEDLSEKVEEIQPDSRIIGVDCSKLLKYYYNRSYINSDGSLVDSVAWQTWQLPLDKEIELKCYSNSNAFYNVGFYSGVPSASTFISGLRPSSYNTLATIQLTSSIIPAGTKVILFASRVSTGNGTSAVFPYEKHYDIRQDVDDIDMANTIGLPNVEKIYRGIPNTNDFIIIKNEIWFAINEYEGGVATENTAIQRFKIDAKGEISYLSTLITDFGHWNSVDYNVHNDCLLFTNSANAETTVGNYFTVIKNPLALSGTVSKENVGINYQVDMGYKVNAVWGESNLGKNNIVYCLSNNSATLTKVLLEKDVNGDFDGNFTVLETRTTNLNKGIGGLAFWNDTIIIGVGVNYVIGFLNVTDLSYKEIQKNFYKDDGTEYSGSTQGICIDNKHLWWFVNVALKEENYLFKINR